MVNEAHRELMSAVIEPETFGTEDEPPVVFIPTAREWAGDDTGPEIELRKLEDNSLALLAYTSLENLAAGAGPLQPYIEVLPSAIEGLQYALGVDVVLWDAQLATSIQHHMIDDEGDDR